MNSPLAFVRRTIVAYSALASTSKRSNRGPMRDDPQPSQSNPTRRAFLQATGSSVAATVVGEIVTGSWRAHR